MDNLEIVLRDILASSLFRKHYEDERPDAQQGDFAACEDGGER